MDLPFVHDSKVKRNIISSVDIFQLPTFKWERKSTTNTPPTGTRYACTNIGKNIFYFGGHCKPLECFHDNLYELNTLTLNWSEIICTTPDNVHVPMRKSGCGMISFKNNGEDKLFLSGGIGYTPVTSYRQREAQYFPFPNQPKVSYTNEIHLMCISSSPGITSLILYNTS